MSLNGMLYLAFLRAINLGANRKFLMSDLRGVLEAEGFADVRTYIQTGNVHLTTRLRNREGLAKRLEEIFAADRGFDVPTAVFTPKEIAQIVTDGEGFQKPGWDSYVTLLLGDPEPDRVTDLEGYAAKHAEAAHVQVRGRAVHIALAEGYRSAKIDNNRVERALGTLGTNRRLGVLRHIHDAWC